MIEDLLTQLDHEPATLDGRSSGSTVRLRTLRVRHVRRRRPRGATACDAREDDAVARRHHIQRAPVPGGRPLAADQVIEGD
jgi:hypothetical protein